MSNDARQLSKNITKCCVQVNYSSKLGGKKLGLDGEPEKN
jgi:hypothetical protein